MANDVKWIKITTDIFDDEKIILIESLPDAYAIITVWFKLLCLAGKQNNSGVFMMGQNAYTDKMLATIFRMKESTVTMALQTFQQFGMVEIIDGVITIPNWGKHQNLDQLESKKEYMRNYMKGYREKQKALTTGKTSRKTNSKANVSRADKEEDKDIDREEEGEEKSVKEQGMKSLLRQIENNQLTYGEQAVCDLIDECMASNWKGIIFDRLKQKPVKQPQQNTRRNGGNVFLAMLDDEEKVIP